MQTNLIWMILNHAGRKCFESFVIDDSGKELGAVESLHELIMEHAKVANGGTSKFVAVPESLIKKRSMTDIGPKMWWLCEKDDPSRGATWSREPEADDVAWVEAQTKRKHVARRLVLE